MWRSFLKRSRPGTQPDPPTEPLDPIPFDAVLFDQAPFDSDDAPPRRRRQARAARQGRPGRDRSVRRNTADPSRTAPTHAATARRRFRRRRLMLIGLAAATAVLVAVQRPPETVAAVAVDAETTLAKPVRDLRNAIFGPPRVGIQIGHLDAGSQPDELAKLRYNTGGQAGGVTELEINKAIAAEVARLLEQRGVIVELLPATVPHNYRADAVVALHADSSPEPWRRGFKTAHFEPARNRAEPQLKAFLDEAYAAASGLPDDEENITGSMLEYYAFNHRRYRHSVSRDTPAVIFEMGYISHPDDLEFLQQAERPAAAIAAGIVRYLEARGRLEPRSADASAGDVDPEGEGAPQETLPADRADGATGNGATGNDAVRE